MKKIKKNKSIHDEFNRFSLGKIQIFVIILIQLTEIYLNFILFSNEHIILKT